MPKALDIITQPLSYTTSISLARIPISAYLNMSIQSYYCRNPYDLYQSDTSNTSTTYPQYTCTRTPSLSS